MFRDNKTTFGQPAPTSTFGGGFNSGNAASPFGQSAFGKPATSSFTDPSNSSARTTLTSIFGGPAPAGGLFGAASATPVFGQAQNAQSSAFGGFQSSPASGGLFGAQQPSGGGLFGASTGAPSAFGANKPAFGGFGTSQASGGLFGQPAQQPQAAPSLFGQPAQTGAGLFGSTGFSSAGQTGTVVKFVPLTGTDTMVKNSQTQTISTKHHCITCMKEYENKSLEELQLEDYMANRKGPQQGAQQGGMFGAPAQPSLFGAGAGTSGGATGGMFSDNKPLFGATNTMGGFGAPQANVFGQMSQPSGGLFGKPTGFGATATTSAPTSGFSFNTPTTALPFGQTATVKPFGAAAPQTNTMFGAVTSQPATGGFSGFGAQPNQGMGLFGQAKPTGFNTMATTSAGYAFGQNTAAVNTGSLFGAKPIAAPAFGTGFSAAAPAPAFGAPGTMFGQTQPGASLFGQPFNKPANTGFSFGQTQPAPSTGLGTGLSLGGGSLFSSTAPKPAGSLFGTTTGSMFNSGGFGTGSTFSGTPGFGNTMSLGGTQTLGGGLGMMGQPAQPPSYPSHQQILALASMPYGDSALFKNLLPATGRADELLKPTNPAAQKAVLSSQQFRVSPRSNVKLKVKPVVANVLSKKSLFDGMDQEENKSEVSVFTPRTSTRRLMLKPAKPAAPDQAPSPAAQQGVSPAPRGASGSPAPTGTSVPPTSSCTTDRGTNPDAEDSWLRVVAGMRPVKDLEGARSPDTLLPASRPSPAMMDNTMAELQGRPAHTIDKEVNTSVVSSADSSLLDVTDRESTPPLIPSTSHPTGIVLTRVGYYTIPPLDELTNVMGEDGSVIVDNFTVGREGYGNVFFADSFDVSGLNLDQIVHFRLKEVTLYPDDEKKPPVGSGLNRRAQVTLDRVWPVDKTTRRPITDPARLEQLDYEQKLQRVCGKLKTRFLEYRPQTGSWVFKVDHFSKYGVDDSDEDEPLPTDIKKLKLTSQAGAQSTPLAAPLPPKSALQQVLGLYLEEDQVMGKPTCLDDADVLDRSTQSPGTRLAHDVVSSHKVQLMKASFFSEDDGQQDIETVDSLVEMSHQYESLRPDGHQYEMLRTDSHQYEGVRTDSPSYEDEPAPSRSHPMFRTQFTGTGRHPLPTTQRPPIVVKTSTARGKTQLAPLQVEGGLPLNDKPVVEVLKYARDEAPPAADSILWKYAALADNIKRPFDIMLLKGLAFKSRWGPDSTLLSLVTKRASAAMPLSGDWAKLGDFLAGRASGDNTVGFVQRIAITGGQVDDPTLFRDTVEPHLQVQLENSVVGSEEDCPAVGPCGGVTALHAHSTVAQRLAACLDHDPVTGAAAQAWDLCAALWGHLDELDTEPSDSHHEAMARRRAVSDWLERVVMPTAKAEIVEAQCGSGADSEMHVSQIVSLLSANQLMEACLKAQQNGDYHLSMLLAQVKTGGNTRQLARHQLAVWQDADADQFIQRDRLKLYALVAGLPLLDSAHGLVNVCEGLDWKRTFALHLWYLCSQVTTVTDALLSYERAFDEPDSADGYAAPPTPAHGSAPTAPRPVYDLCYHLLCLYGTKTHPLDRLLNPATHSADPFDYRLSWFLQETLLAIGYSHGSNLSAAVVHTGFASQLESNGMWHWAVFVLLHLRHLGSRRSAILDVLGRHVRLSGEPEYEERESFLRDRLHIPPQWIIQAKATLASSLGRHEEAASYLIEAGQWNEAHQVIMQHIAANAICNERYGFLSTMLSALEPVERSCAIAGWSTGGHLLRDFLAVMAEVDALLANRDLAHGYQMERLCPQLNSLCQRIHMLPCPTPIHRMCQVHIAKVTSSLAQTYIGLQRADTGAASVNLARLVTQLPLPEDCAQQVLNVITRSCVNDNMP